MNGFVELTFEDELGQKEFSNIKNNSNNNDDDKSISSLQSNKQ